MPEEEKAANGTHADSANGISSKMEKMDIENDDKKPLKYPWYIIFILGNEFCERFSYYGMKAVLTIYFLQVLMWDGATSTLVYHLFSVLAYFSPVFGAMLADGFLGKFNTIFSLSIVYVAGLVLLTLAAVPPLGLNLVAGTAAGLLLIGLGTGGIKPVVPAYGGDQFVPGQEKQREQFFSLFYFSINSGSLISTFLTPELRDQPCFGMESCFPLAFGVPAGLLAVAVIAFVLGRPFYRNVPSKDNIIAKVFGCSFSALFNKIRGRGPAGAKHWLDCAGPKYSSDFVKDVKQALPVLKLFLPLPFWALFDQQGSRWTLQATRMDGRITDSYTWKPDQMQIFNPILILALIPVFEIAVFPLLAKMKIPFRPLARMVVGMILAGIAFVVAGVLQMQLDNTLPKAVAPSTAEINVYNGVPCELTFEGNFTTPAEPFTLKPYLSKSFPTFPVESKTGYLSIKVSAAADCVAVDQKETNFIFDITEQNVHSILYSVDKKKLVHRQLVTKEKKKPENGQVEVRFLLPFKFATTSGSGAVTLINPNAEPGTEGHMFSMMIDHNVAMYEQGSSVADATITLDAGSYELYYPNQTSPTGRTRAGSALIPLANGGVLNVVLKEDISEKEPWAIFDVVPPSSLSVFWQLPQIFVITLGEVMFSVSGLSFAYSQAPPTMKSVLQAGWLLAVAVGNVIVMIISGAQLIADESTEYFVFAGLIAVFAGLFAWMSKSYVYIVQKTPEPVTEKKQVDDSETL